MPHVIYSTAIPPGIPWWSPWSRSVMLGSAESEHPKLISHETIFEIFQPVWPEYLNITDGQTDNIYSDNTALCTAPQ